MNGIQALSSFFLPASLDYCMEYSQSGRLYPSSSHHFWGKQQRQEGIILTFPTAGSTGVQGYEWLVGVHCLMQDNSG